MKLAHIYKIVSWMKISEYYLKIVETLIYVQIISVYNKYIVHYVIINIYFLIIYTKSHINKPQISYEPSIMKYIKSTYTK